MKAVAIALAAALAATPVHAFPGQTEDCGENITPLNSVTHNVDGGTNLNNNMVTLAQTPNPPPAGIYIACGNFTAKGLETTTFTTRHGDVGTNPLSIDTAPAGESANGDHRHFTGDPAAYSVLTFDYPTGCRLLALDGTQKIYTHQITSWSPSDAVVTMSGSLLWCKLR